MSIRNGEATAIRNGIADNDSAVAVHREASYVTTDATPAVGLSVPLDDLGAYMVEALVSCRGTAVSQAIALVNDVAVQYEVHRVLTTGGVHGAADATNALTAAHPATTTAEAITLANDLRTKYEAHRVRTTGGVHGAADNTNTMAAAAATDGASLLTLARDLKVKYEAHRVLIAGGVHGLADATDVVTAAADATLERAAYGVRGLYYREGTGATIQGSVSAVFTAIETTAGMDATLVVSGNNVNVQVTGKAATTLHWTIALQCQRAS